MDSHEIEKYLTELGTELKARGVKKPIRMMIIGGAYMLLLENAPRSTNDIDIFWLEEDAFQHMRSTLSECALTITRKYRLDPSWFNYLTQVIMQHDIIIPDGKHGNDLDRCISMSRPKSTFLHSKSRLDERKILRIVLYYSHRQNLEHVNKLNNY